MKKIMPCLDLDFVSAAICAFLLMALAAFLFLFNWADEKYDYVDYPDDNLVEEAVEVKLFELFGLEMDLSNDTKEDDDEVQTEPQVRSEAS